MQVSRDLYFWESDRGNGPETLCARRELSMTKSKGLAVLVGLALLVGTGAYVQQTGAREGLTALTPADHVEIRNLYAKYNHYVDNAKDEGWAYANLWTKDGVFHINLADPRVIRGDKELAELANGAGMAPPFVRSAHHAVNIMIEPSAEGANSAAYLFMMSSPTESTSATGLSAIYHDQLVKTDGGWKFKVRTLDLATPMDAG
jgi:hypothetical protein